MEHSKTLKYHTFFINQYFFLLFVISGSKDETIFKEKDSTEILRILGLINNMEECQMNIIILKWVKETSQNFD